MTTQTSRDEVTLYSNNSPSPIGQVSLVSAIHDGRGVQPPLPMRIYDSYALVCITAGRGTYTDANGTAVEVNAGDAILVFPGLPHTYGPRLGETWNEFFVIFNGPAFDAWRQIGLISLSHPVVHLAEMEVWVDRLRELALPPDAGGTAAHVRQVCRLLAVLAELMLATDSPHSLELENGWIGRACVLLSKDLSDNRAVCELVGSLGLPYETFRKKFKQAIGQSPARYRAQKRIEMAAQLMQYTSMSNSQIVDHLNFGDEFYFSKRFKTLRGETPTAFRRRMRG